jgi:glycosyltransferase involved in cell wall biosynthesis
MVLVSVVIPAFNAEEWIAETIASVLGQSYRNIEIVVVDDGSTDLTLSAAEDSLQESRFPYKILRQPNAGAAEARNLGWRAAHGSWVQFLDADDLLVSQKIELQVTCLQRSDPADVIYSDWQKLIWSRRAWEAHDFRTPNIRSDALADILSDRNFLQLGSLLFRRDILDAVGGFDASHEPIEDIGLCVKVAIAGGVFRRAQSNGPVAFYRDLPRSFSKTNHVRFIESCIKNAKLAERSIQHNPEDSSRVIEAIVEVYYSGARFFAGLDWERFEEIVSDIEVLQPNFIPRKPAKLRLLSRLAGYRTAEKAAVLFRKSKSMGTNFWRKNASN